MSGKSLRLRRFFSRPRTVIIPMDHPMFAGPLPGLEDPVELVRLIARTEADGILASPWILPRVADVLGRLAVIARLDGGNSCLGQRVDQTQVVTSVEQALRLGADMVAINIFVGGGNEPEMLQKLGYMAEACHTWGMPLMAEMIPSVALDRHYGKDNDQAQEKNLADPVAIVSRIGAEFGGDIIKTVYTGHQDSFTRVVRDATIPIVVAGGPKTGSDAEFLGMVKTCMEAGAAGVCIGRNVWQRPRVEGMIAALGAIVHDGASVDEAMRLL
jgi:DhnA family fructose-bisphosphate aldolase class Ia